MGVQGPSRCCSIAPAASKMPTEDELRAAQNPNKSAIRNHGVSWQKHAQQQTIGSDHLPVIQQFDKADVARQTAMLDDPTSGPLIAEALAMILKKMDYALVDDLEYVLLQIDEILDLNRKYAGLFRDLTSVDVFKNILDLMSWDKKFSANGVHVLGVLFYPGLGYGDAIINGHLDNLVDACMAELEVNTLSQSTCRKMCDMLSCFIVILREDSIRKHVNDNVRLHGHLSSLLEKALDLGDVQLLYQIGFCLWLLSFDADIAESKMTTTNVVMNILKVIKSVSREKVIRVCMACLRNLVDKADHSQVMLEHEALKLLGVLRNRKWTDDEVKEDLDFVYDALAKSMRVLSSIEMYEKELHSGKLEWTPVHKSETFWRENVMKICPVISEQQKGASLIKTLTGLLVTLEPKFRSRSMDSEEATTLAIVCHDLGEFARFHPNGKKFLQGDAEENGKSTKDILMSIMQAEANPYEEVAKNALTCIHKMMVTNWQFLEPK